MRSIIAKIETLSDSFTKTDRRIASYVKKNQKQVVYMSLTELSDVLKVSEGSIIRFCKKVGLAGFYELKISLAISSGDSSEQLDSVAEFHQDVSRMREAVANRNHQIIRDTNDLISDSAVEASISLILKADSILIVGVGASGITANEAFHRFMRIGLKCQFSVDSHLQTMLASSMGKGDLLIAVSQSGSTVEVVKMAQMASKKGAGVIALTGYARSPLASAADQVLLTPTRESPLENVATRSKIAQLHVLDILFVGVYGRMPSMAKESIKRTSEAISQSQW